MALTRIRKRGIRSDAVNEHVSFTNIVDTGTEGTKLAAGTTAQRGSTQGHIRFNSTTGLAEYYDGTAFKGLDTPPVVSSIDDGDIDSGAGGNQTIVITGSNFTSTVSCELIANSGSNIIPSTVIRNSATQVTIVVPKSSFVNANLQSSNFVDSSLQNIDFTNANLKNANFTNANLDNVNFLNANLENVFFKDTTLQCFNHIICEN